jgi:hypothetical protein
MITLIGDIGDVRHFHSATSFSHTVPLDASQEGLGYHGNHHVASSFGSDADVLLVSKAKAKSLHDSTAFPAAKNPRGKFGGMSSNSSRRSRPSEDEGPRGPLIFLIPTGGCPGQMMMGQGMPPIIPVPQLTPKLSNYGIDDVLLKSTTFPNLNNLKIRNFI